MKGHSESLAVGVVLAGGASRRMEGSAASGGKALAELSGQPMVHWAMTRLRPQVSELWLSVPEQTPAFLALGEDLIVDQGPHHRGPLAGLQSALLRLCREASASWLILAPCDAPFLPLDLAGKLLAAANETGTLAAVAQDAHGVQPTFSAWHRENLEPINRLLERPGGGGLMTLLDQVPHTRVPWAELDPSVFMNVNTPEDLLRAKNWLDELNT